MLAALDTECQTVWHGIVCQDGLSGLSMGPSAIWACLTVDRDLYAD